MGGSLLRKPHQSLTSFSFSGAPLSAISKFLSGWSEKRSSRTSENYGSKVLKRHHRIDAKPFARHTIFPKSFVGFPLDFSGQFARAKREEVRDFDTAPIASLDGCEPRDPACAPCSRRRARQARASASEPCRCPTRIRRTAGWSGSPAHAARRSRRRSGSRHRSRGRPGRSPRPTDRRSISIAPSPAAGSQMQGKSRTERSALVGSGGVRRSRAPNTPCLALCLRSCVVRRLFPAARRVSGSAGDALDAVHAVVDRVGHALDADR
jgi:hypothetical protein